MREDINEDYSSKLIYDSKENEENLKAPEPVNEKEKINIPPEINSITECENENKQEINSKIILNKKKSLINKIEYILDNLIDIGEDKQKYKNDFADLKKQRNNEDEITLDEFNLLNILLNQINNPNEINYDKIFKEENKETNDLYINKNNYLDDKKEEIYVNELYDCLMKKENKNSDIITSSPEISAEDNTNTINLNENIVNSNDLFNENKTSFNCISCLFNFCHILRNTFDFCFKEGDYSYFEGYKLDKSFIYYFVQYALLAFDLSNSKDIEEEVNLVLIYAIIIFVPISIYLFYKMYFKKYHENYSNINCYILFWYFYSIIIFKIFLYLIIYLIIKSGFHTENTFKILGNSFFYKAIFLLYCIIYFNYRDGLIHYLNIIIFGIVELLIMGLISLKWFNLKNVIIELILCAIEMIRFHIAIFLVKYKKTLINSKIWNTLNFEVFSLAIFLYPIFACIIAYLTILTFGGIWLCISLKE